MRVKSISVTDSKLTCRHNFSLYTKFTDKLA